MMEELRKNIVVFCEKYEAYFNTKRVLENTKYEVGKSTKYDSCIRVISTLRIFKTTHIYCH